MYISHEQKGQTLLINKVIYQSVSKNAEATVVAYREGKFGVECSKRWGAGEVGFRSVLFHFQFWGGNLCKVLYLPGNHSVPEQHLMPLNYRHTGTHSKP